MNECLYMNFKHKKKYCVSVFKFCQGIEKVYQGVVKWFHHLQIKQTIFCVHLMLRIQTKIKMDYV